MVEKQKDSVLKIPKNCFNQLLADRQEFKAVVIWLELKPLFYNGTFRQARKRANELSNYLGISKRSYYYKIKKLKEMDLIEFNEKGDLVLCSWNKFFNYFGAQKESKRFKWYRLKNSVNVEFAIRQIVIEENLKAQNKTIDLKIFLQEVCLDRQTNLLREIVKIQQNDLIPTKDKERQIKTLNLELRSNKRKWLDTKNDPEFKKYKSNGMLTRLFVQAYKNYEESIKRPSLDYPSIDPVPSLSCGGVAQLFGLKSQSSGYYWQKRLEQRGQLKTSKRSIFCPGFKVSEYNHAIQNGVDLKGHFFASKSGVYRRLNNAFNFTPLVTA